MSPRDRNIALAELAQQELIDVLQYTLETWGDAQMASHAAKLGDGMLMLQANPYLGNARDDLFEECRIYRVGRHLILYVIGDQEIRGTRILRERMNVDARFEH